MFDKHRKHKDEDCECEAPCNEEILSIDLLFDILDTLVEIKDLLKGMQPPPQEAKLVIPIGTPTEQ